MAELDPFWAIAKRIAKRLGGGKIVRILPESGEWTHWVITLKRPGELDLAAVNAEFRADDAIVFGSVVDYATSKRGKRSITVREVTVLHAKSIADAVVGRYGDKLRPVVNIVEQHCGIESIEKMEGRVLALRTARVPKRPTDAIRALMAATKGWDSARSQDEWKRELADQRISLWWDP